MLRSMRVPLWIGVLVAVFVTPRMVDGADVIATYDREAVEQFRANRTVLTFDEVEVAPPWYMTLPADTYLGLGIQIRAGEDGSDLTNVARVPEIGNFGPTLSPPNIIGGGTAPESPGWRTSIRFDFPSGPATAIGADTDWTGSNTTLTAHAADGAVIAEVSGDQGMFLGISNARIAYAIWTWNFDQGAWGFSLDNVAFAVIPLTPGDMNCDGDVNFADINPFVMALTGQAPYESAFPNCRWLNGDCNGDGTVNFADINPFVALLSGQ